LNPRFTCIAQSVGNTTHGNHPHRLHRREMRTTIKTHHPVARMMIRKTIRGKFSRLLLIKYGWSWHLQVNICVATRCRCAICKHCCEGDATHERERDRDTDVNTSLGVSISYRCLLSSFLIHLHHSTLSSSYSLTLPPTLTQQTSPRDP
jgi:hypothetical protein